MALTLLEAKKTESDPARNAVISELAEGELIGMLPMRDLDSAGLFYEQEGELPYVGFRAVNEGASESYGVLNPQTEALKIMSTDVDIDLANLDWHGEDQRATQIQMKVKSMRMNIEDLLINGDSRVDARQFDGLKSRIQPGSSQYIDCGGACSIEKLEELCDAVDTGDKVLVMGKKMRRRLSKASRSPTIGGYINYEQDQFGRMVRFFNEVPIVTVDVNSANQPILPFTETGSTTSIYCLSLGETAVTGLQGRCRGQFGVSVRPLGEVPDAPVDRTRIEWYIAMAIMNGRAAARLAGITDADVVA